MFKTSTIREISKVASDAGMEPAALLAVAEVESGGVAFTTVEGRQEPLIRFEGHYFDRRLSAEDRVIARDAGLASPQAGAIANPSSQAARWRMLERAAAIDRAAAWESVSWGLGQVMGAHWQWLGFPDVDALVREARSGAAGQARLMTRYIAEAGLADVLKRHDWQAFARAYNGPGYRKHAYDTKLAAAYSRHLAGTGDEAPPASRTNLPAVRSGSRGEDVRNLQQALSALGYPLGRDGVFGRQTEEALRAFQRDHGLKVDGIAGPLTRQAMTDAMPFDAWYRRIWRWLSGFLPANSGKA
ncbi:MAG: DUF3380 domain-containing protein [Rhizobiaceae bacterium]|nr:DUF3380 domain-containing protein [Rhizobiaceae bacterium]